MASSSANDDDDDDEEPDHQDSVDSQGSASILRPVTRASFDDVSSYYSLPENFDSLCSITPSKGFMLHDLSSASSDNTYVVTSDDENEEMNEFDFQAENNDDQAVPVFMQTPPGTPQLSMEESAASYNTFDVPDVVDYNSGDAGSHAIPPLSATNASDSSLIAGLQGGSSGSDLNEPLELQHYQYLLNHPLYAELCESWRALREAPAGTFDAAIIDKQRRAPRTGDYICLPEMVADGRMVIAQVIELDGVRYVNHDSATSTSRWPWTSFSARLTYTFLGRSGS